MYRNKIIIGLLTVFWGISAESSPLTFKFNPPDSITFSVEVKSERTRWFDSTKNSTDSSISVVRRTIKRTPTGFTMTARPQSIVTKIGGQAVDSPVNTVLKATRVTSQLDTLGLITTVTGYDRIPQQLDSLFTGQTAARLKEVLKPENLAAREQLEWNGKLQGLAGESVDIGKISYEKAEYPIPGGTHIPFMVAVQVVDTIELHGKACAILLISAGSDPNEMARFLRVPTDEIAMNYPMNDAAGMAVVKAGSRYFSETRVVLEIATLLPQSESSRREITVMGEPGQAVRKMRLVESETRRYNYRL
jgi:hypothetical protein